jgi:chromosome condensin MukBEF ATPase and DNA-binding subunit MukB
MRFADLKAEYTQRYDAKDPEAQTMLALFEKADKLSGAAKQEFVDAFNYQFALNGKVYLGVKLNAAYKYPHLLAEAEAVGIRVETREP